MPAEVANTNVPSGSLEGATLFLCNDQERIEALDKAFDYRGDVTLDLANGEKVEGFLFNRDAATAQAELFIKGSDEPRVIPYADIVAIAFTGKDPASGKSWQDWVTKKHSERKAEAEKIAADLKEKGYL
jgi:hypothetical protein